MLISLLAAVAAAAAANSTKCARLVPYAGDHLIVAEAEAFAGDAGWEPCRDGSGSGPLQVDVFRAGERAPWGTVYACFRVPSAVQLGRGSLLVFVEARIGDCSDQAPKDIVSRRSEDRGVTWGAEMALVVGVADRATRPSNFTARNPYATVDDRGRVVLGWVDTTHPSRCAYLQQVSDSTGATWSAPRELDFGAMTGVGLLPGPGTGIVLGRHSPLRTFAGRMVGCGATGYVGSSKTKGDRAAAVWYSDDGGETYRLSAGAAPFGGLEECQLVELKNGSVLLNARNHHLNASCACRATAISHDGAATFEPYTFDPALPEPICSAGMLSFAGDLFFTNPASSTARVNMTLKRSVDSAATWEAVSRLWEGPSGYSVLTPVSDTSIGVVYERGTSTYRELVTMAIVDVAAEADLSPATVKKPVGSAHEMDKAPSDKADFTPK